MLLNSQALLNVIKRPYRLFINDFDPKLTVELRTLKDYYCNLQGRTRKQAISAAISENRLEKVYCYGVSFDSLPLFVFKTYNYTMLTKSTPKC